MTRIILIYGALAGAVINASFILSIVLAGGEVNIPIWAGYLIMLAALSLIFAAVKRHRDNALGGVITFVQGLAVGMGVAAVASVVYVLIWEVYLWLTDYTFINSYTQGIIAAKKAAGVSPAELASLRAEMAAMVVDYHNPIIRLWTTLWEILPVAVAMALLSAAILRYRNVLPARGSAKISA